MNAAPATIRNIILLAILLLYCSPSSAQKTPDGLIEFTSSDSVLQNGFRWAKLQALKYVRRNNDPVGDWYEAALPERNAFCMRDVAHQLTGANLLGLADINKNVLVHFVASISLSRDWCGYWEIDKTNQPAAVDYKNDNDFWFNLPGNFDILNACLRQYQWTSDTAFLFNKALTNFYLHTTNDYVAAWDKNADGIMEGNYSIKHHDRGIGSYDEAANGITGNDLIAAQAIGYRSYASLLNTSGKDQQAKIYIDKSKQLFKIFDKAWWDDKNKAYYHFKTKDGWLHNDVMQLFLLRWDFISPERIEPVLKSLLKHESEMNVEMRSYFAREIFRYGDAAEGRRLLKVITNRFLKRREYPEVSYSALEAYAEGLMGIEVDIPKMMITTLSRISPDDKAELSRLPLIGGTISIVHEGLSKSVFTNNTKQVLYWNACFSSEGGLLKINGNTEKAEVKKDLHLHKIISTTAKVLPGMSCTMSTK